MIDWGTADRMQCSAEEKQKLYWLLDFFEGLSVKARKEGLLALEESAQSEVVKERPMFALGLELVVDGLDPSELEATLTDLIRSANHKGSALLERLIILEGLLAIQRGYGTRMVWARIASLFGENSGVPGLSPHDYFTREQLQRRLDARGDFDAHISHLEFLVAAPDDIIQRLCGSLNQEQIASGLSAASSGLMRKFLGNIAPRAAHQIFDAMEEATSAPEPARKAQEQILGIYGNLIQDGTTAMRDGAIE